MEGSQPEMENFVIQCQECRTIIGDSSAVSLMSQDLVVFNPNDPLASATTSAIGTLEVSKSEWDTGCSFVKIKCSCCGKTMGKRYQTTPSHLDYIREAVCVELSSVTIHRIGNPSESSSDLPRGSFVTATSLWKHIERVTSILIVQSERIDKLEEIIRQSGMSDDK